MCLHESSHMRVNGSFIQHSPQRVSSGPAPQPCTAGGGGDALLSHQHHQ